MGNAPEPKERSSWQPLVVTALGIALVAPVPLFAARPDFIPFGLLDRIAGAPVLSWGLTALMGGFVAVAIFAMSNPKSSDG